MIQARTIGIIQQENRTEDEGEKGGWGKRRLNFCAGEKKSVAERVRVSSFLYKKGGGSHRGLLEFVYIHIYLAYRTEQPKRDFSDKFFFLQLIR